ncbi:MAG: DUF4350 domain-containing protein [Kofleriaceae bacterium]|nr:DUF4350 domain-containing protein [Myxococcales bacterium]MCB9559947.1 DUF4350 domain-containing protein [Kofleriaceae bacterium]MCB9571562.1 DUF4350 domain-containing protein [Kofleriaceae bacterium]
MSEVVADARARSPFTRRMLFILIGIGVASLIAALALAVFADDLSEEPTAGANGYSTSAIGHAALAEILEELDVPVIRSRTDSAARAHNGVLVIAEPAIADDDVDAQHKLRAMVEGARRVLLVLPRWWGSRDDERPRWISGRNPLARDEVAAVLAALDLDAELTTVTDPLDSYDPDLPVPALATAQLVGGDLDLEPDVATEEGLVLLGHTWFDADTELWVLADPTPIQNAGLRRPANVQFAVALLDQLREGGPVVFDEVLHGFEEQPSLWKALFRFPLVLATLTALLSAVLLLWAAVGRFGPAHAAAPAVPSGKDFLIRHTAALLHGGGHDGHALRRYLATTIQAVAVKLHAPRDLGPTNLRHWLERVRASRHVTITLPDLEREVAEVAATPRPPPRRLVELAARIHRWRTEMTHGSDHRP